MTDIVSYTRVAIVTGGAHGIGLSIALRLADDGLDIAVNDLAANGTQLDDVVSQIKSKGRRAIAVPADVAQDNEVKSMVSTVVERLGRLDVMVANAGIFVAGPIIETTVQDWDKICSVNIRGVMLCYKYAAIQMIKQGQGGRILGASSIYGKKGGPLASAYSTTKFAIRGLTQSAALELAQHKITVNTYAPGLIKAGISEAFFNEPGVSRDERMQQLGFPADTPLPGPEVVSSLVSYLVKPEAYFITGQTIMTNGGTVLD